MISVRCSELDRVLPCPGSLTLVPMVAPRTGKEAHEGQCLHHDSALQIIARLGGTAPDGLPPHNPDWPSLKVSKWISDFYVRHIQESVPPDWSIEVEVALSYEYAGFILSGHIDCCAISPDGKRAKGFDLKTGRDPVSPAEENEQFFAYSCNLKRAYPTLECIEFDGVQPNNDPDEGFERVSHMELSGARLEAAIATLERRVNAALARPMDLDSGRKQCRWCDAKLQCPAYRAERDLMKLTMTKQHIEAVRREPEDTTLADWVLVGKTLASGFEDAEEMAKERISKMGALVASDGTQITVKTTPGSYKVLDPLGMWKAVAELLPEERRALAAKWSMAALDDQIAEQFSVPKGGKGAVTGRSLRVNKTGAFVEQGTRSTFQFK